jgi:cyanophycinase
MSQVIITNPTSIGIGIEEDTAILVKEGTNIEVVGTGLVIIIEGFEIEATNMDEFSEDKPVTARNLKMHLLSSGEVYEIPQVNPPHK